MGAAEVLEKLKSNTNGNSPKFATTRSPGLDKPTVGRSSGGAFSNAAPRYFANPSVTKTAHMKNLTILGKENFLFHGIVSTTNNITSWKSWSVTIVFSIEELVAVVTMITIWTKIRVSRMVMTATQDYLSSHPGCLSRGYPSGASPIPMLPRLPALMI